MSRFGVASFEMLAVVDAWSRRINQILVRQRSKRSFPPQERLARDIQLQAVLGKPVALGLERPTRFLARSCHSGSPDVIKRLA